MDNNKPIRILHITEMLSAAGIESFIMNMYRKIDRSKVQFDFLVLRNQKEFYDEEVKKMGGKKYFVHSEKENTLLRVLEESKMIEEFLRKHKYNIVHIHYTTPLRAPYLLAAKRAGVKIRIYHSHSAYVSGKNSIKKIIYALMRKGINKWTTHYFACSEAAAEWMFTKKIIDEKRCKIIYNGIDIDKFEFNPVTRKEIRQEFGVDKDFVIVNIGRFSEQKNQQFSIEVFRQFKMKCPNTKLILIGTGKLLNNMKKVVQEYQLEEYVLFTGVRSDVNRILSGADCFIMPSLYEGLPVSAIEAQCAGLPCVLSDNITQEVKMTDSVSFLSLNDSIDTWCNEIFKYKNIDRVNCTNAIIDKGYEINTGARALEKFYLKAVH